MAHGTVLVSALDTNDVIMYSGQIMRVVHVTGWNYANSDNPYRLLVLDNGSGSVFGDVIVRTNADFTVYYLGANPSVYSKFA